MESGHKSEGSKTTPMPATNRNVTVMAGVTAGAATVGVLSMTREEEAQRREDNHYGGVAVNVVEPLDSDRLDTTRSDVIDFDDISSAYSDSVDLDNERDQIDDEEGDDGDDGGGDGGD